MDNEDLSAAQKLFKDLPKSKTPHIDAEKIRKLIIGNNAPFEVLYQDRSKTSYEALEAIERSAPGSALKTARLCYKAMAEETDTENLAETMRHALMLGKKDYAALDPEEKTSNEDMIGKVFHRLLNAAKRREEEADDDYENPMRGNIIIIPLPHDFQP